MTISLGTGAGTGPSYTFIGTDEYGSISITTGTGTSPSGDIVTFTFGNPVYTNALIVRFTPTNANAQGLIAGSARINCGQYGGGAKQTSFTLGGTASIADSTTYTFAYSVS